MSNSEKIQGRLTREYQKQGIKAESDDHWVLDSRNERLSGPFSEMGAKQTAVQLNDFACRCGGVQEKPFAVLNVKGEQVQPVPTAQA